MTFDLSELPCRKNPKKRRTYNRKSLGKLHQLLTDGLPEFRDESGICDLNAVAESIGISYQGVHKWMRPHEKHAIPAKHALFLVKLSNEMKTRSKDKTFKPLEFHQFTDFIR